MLLPNIDKEKKLVEMLGYNLIGPDNSNRWLIVDENNNQVGFIQYKKLFKKNNKKGYPATFGYHMEIDNSIVRYNSTRKLNNIDCRTSFDPGFSYGIDIKRENGDIDHAKIKMNEYPSLNLWSKEYGNIIFMVDNDGLYLNYKSKTENFNVEELVVFKSDGENVFDRRKEYTYQIRYCNRETEISDNSLKGITIREISGSSTQYQQAYNKIKLSERTWINGKLRTNRENEVIGTVEEMVTKHQMGIESFNCFRFLINQILPFKEDIISLMSKTPKLQNQDLSLFISEVESANIEKEFQKKLKK